MRDGRNWHYLDDGIYGSYSNVMTEDCTRRSSRCAEILDGPMDSQPVVLAGATCDSADVIARDYPIRR